MVLQGTSGIANGARKYRFISKSCASDNTFTHIMTFWDTDQHPGVLRSRMILICRKTGDNSLELVLFGSHSAQGL
jgi:hypothetical protein